MSPVNKLTNSKLGSKGNLSCPNCPYCGFGRCWKHGTYERKGFHRLPGEQQHGTETVQRYLCLNPPCEHTFSKLPEEVLPYCRFYLSGLLRIVHDLTDGRTAYWISKYRWHLPLRVILRAVGLIKMVTPWLGRLHREAAGMIATGFQGGSRLPATGSTVFTPAAPGISSTHTIWALNAADGSFYFISDGFFTKKHEEVR